MFEILCMLFVDLDSYHLKERLSENEDFILVPSEAWQKLLSWYDLMDDQPPLERKVVLTRLLTFLCIGVSPIRQCLPLTEDDVKVFIFLFPGC